MKYCFTTLAINEPYESKTEKFYNELKKNTEKCNFFITTMNEKFLNLDDSLSENIGTRIF